MLLLHREVDGHFAGLSATLSREEHLVLFSGLTLFSNHCILLPSPKALEASSSAPALGSSHYYCPVAEERLKVVQGSED